MIGMAKHTDHEPPGWRNVANWPVNDAGEPRDPEWLYRHTAFVARFSITVTTKQVVEHRQGRFRQPETTSGVS